MAGNLFGSDRRLPRLTDDGGLPPLPPVNSDGTSNAVEFARAAIARRVIVERRKSGMSQRELAKISGVRQETISRIESGKNTATVRVIDKLEKALHRGRAEVKRRKAS
jgi:ribosome-binding protein aMBF1 (putative translation factor)